MFTGIIEGLGTVKSAIGTGGGMRMHIQGDFPLEGIRVGDSIAVNGACLTAVKVDEKAFTVDVAPETLSRTTLGHIKVGHRVNLERALCLGDRLSGHLVTGHIDGIGRVKTRQPLANAILFAFTVPEALSRYIVEKGSVAIDGISLTVNTCDQRGFEVSIIPHTASITTMGLRRAGDLVNIETDMVGKYVERFTQHVVTAPAKSKEPGASVDETLLKKTGFMFE
ncbi:MAG: riboflavin synthase [Thermodesulfobacteriota bacterium]|nr:riboflavin synthase [Thermodesulfobacteriota bacterium]